MEAKVIWSCSIGENEFEVRFVRSNSVAYPVFLKDGDESKEDGSLASEFMRFRRHGRLRVDLGWKKVFGEARAFLESKGATDVKTVKDEREIDPDSWWG